LNAMDELLINEDVSKMANKAFDDTNNTAKP
jgi:hypothetical protein